MDRSYRAAIVLIACSLSACAGTPKDHGSAGGAAAAGAFIVRTTPAGALVETTQPFSCTSPCQVPISPTAFVATVTLLGYKPVQIPVAASKNPGPIDVKLVPQDPGAGAPNPTK